MTWWEIDDVKWEQQIHSVQTIVGDVSRGVPIVSRCLRLLHIERNGFPVIPHKLEILNLHFCTIDRKDVAVALLQQADPVTLVIRAGIHMEPLLHACRTLPLRFTRIEWGGRFQGGVTDEWNAIREIARRPLTSLRIHDIGTDHIVVQSEEVAEMLQPELETLKLPAFSSTETYAFMEKLKTLPKLKELSLDMSGIRSAAELLRYIEAIPHLEDLKLALDLVPFDGIRRLLQKCPCLKTFHLRINPSARNVTMGVGDVSAFSEFPHIRCTYRMLMFPQVQMNPAYATSDIWMNDEVAWGRLPRCRELQSLSINVHTQWPPEACMHLRNLVKLRQLQIEAVHGDIVQPIIEALANTRLVELRLHLRSLGTIIWPILPRIPSLKTLRIVSMGPPPCIWTANDIDALLDILSTLHISVMLHGPAVAMMARGMDMPQVMHGAFMTSWKQYFMSIREYMECQQLIDCLIGLLYFGDGMWSGYAATGIREP